MRKRKQWAISLVLVFAMLFQLTGTAFASGVADLLEETTVATEVAEGSAELEGSEDAATEGSAETAEASGDSTEFDGADADGGGAEGSLEPGLAEAEEGGLSDLVGDEPGEESEDLTETGDEEAGANVPAESETEYVAPGVWSDADPYFTDEVRPEIEFSDPFGAFPSPFVFGDPFGGMFGMPSAIAEVAYPTSAEVYTQLIALKSEFPEGMRWTNYEPYGSKGTWGDSYCFQGGIIKGARYGVGCAALVFQFQDNVFGYLPIRVIDNPKRSDFHVGDFVRVNSSHFVMILQIAAGGVTVVEGNYNSSVHWGRAISWDALEQMANFSVTRYPTWYSEEGSSDDVAKSGTEGSLKWTLTQGGVLTISGNGAMPDYSYPDNRPSWEQSGNPISSVEIEPGVTSVGNYVFYGQTDLIGASLPNTVTRIGNSAFRGTNIVGMSIPGSCKTVGDDAFRDCASLASIDIGNGVETIGQRAFHSCMALGYVDFPGSLKNLGAAAFTSCRDLTQVRFMPNKNGLVIGNGAFTQCWYLNFVSLPEGITQIPPGLFQSCQGIAYLYIPSTVTVLDEVGKTSPFTSTLVSIIYFGGTQAQWNNLTKNIPASLQSTRDMLTYATVVVDQKDPFVEDENQPDDLIGCKDGQHLGPIENGVCQNCGENANGVTPVEPVDPPAEHKHVWSTDWSHNATHHWHECLVGGYFGCENDQKSGYAAHDFGDWEVLVEATTEHAGMRQRICETCGHYETEEIPRLPDGTIEDEHKWSTTFAYDGNNHWLVCENYNCVGVTNGAENSYERHKYGEWTVHQVATTTHDGEQYRDCEVCGYRETAVIPKLPDPTNPLVQHLHNWSKDFSYDDAGHWNDCSVAGCPITENMQKSGYGEHEFGEVVIVTQPTETAAGSGHKDCVVCSYSMTVVIPATGGTTEPVDPTPEKHQCEPVEAWSSNSTNHWHECAKPDCPITENSEKDSFGAHELSDLVVDTPATATVAGSGHKTCAICGYRVDETIPATGSGTNPGTTTPTNPGGTTPTNPGGTTSPSRPTGGGSSTTTQTISTTTKRNPDGSTTTTVTNKTTGVTTETTVRPDGTKVVKTTQKDGSSTLATTEKDGTTVTISTGTDGWISNEVKLSTAAVNAAEQRGEPVTLPLGAVPVTRNLMTAEPITILSEKGGTVKVEIPVSGLTPGTVVVLVGTDASTNIVKTTVPTKNGVVASLPSGATVQIVDNSKSFADVPADAWYSDAVAFASACELFAGTSATDFSPAAPMTRAMLMVVLARFDGAATAGGETWYAKAIEWATAHGVSDGSRPNERITREQLVTMLWRYMGSPVPSGNLSGYSDVAQISSYAQDAMRWAVENGLINGFGDGRLGPQSEATRAQVATILKNLIINLMQ